MEREKHSERNRGERVRRGRERNRDRWSGSNRVRGERGNRARERIRRAGVTEGESKREREAGT